MVQPKHFWLIIKLGAGAGVGVLLGAAPPRVHPQ